IALTPAQAQKSLAALVAELLARPGCDLSEAFVSLLQQFPAVDCLESPLEDSTPPGQQTEPELVKTDEQPDRHRVYHRLAETLEELGCLDEAAQAYQRSIQLQPQSVPSVVGLSRVVERSRTLEKEPSRAKDEAVAATRQASQLNGSEDSNLTPADHSPLATTREKTKDLLHLLDNLWTQKTGSPPRAQGDLLPNFLGIGAQKSGTTWLYAMLKKHPQIYLPPNQKELMFFDSEGTYNTLGIEGYKTFFKPGNSPAVKAVGEITPGYLWTSPFGAANHQFDEFRATTPKRVYQALGADLKLLVLLRNPVQRAISAYLHHLNRRRIPVGKSILDFGHKFGILHMGFYSKHLFHWMDYYPRKCFHIAIYENILKDKDAYFKDVFDFLEVNNNYQPSEPDKLYNKPFQYQATDQGISMVIDQENRTVINRTEIQALYEIYQEEIHQLEQLFNLEVSSWKSASETCKN
ncbi:MAG: tetratricopeptide repeat protein, partial [Phormidium sp. GEM2.Bin31]